MKHGVKVALLGVLLVLMNVGNLFANAESPKTDFFGAMFNLNLVYPNVFMEENTDDDVEDLYGVFVSLFSGRLNIDKHYHYEPEIGKIVYRIFFVRTFIREN